jgi:serine/threonine-protein kinase
MTDPLDGLTKYRAIQELGRGGMGVVYLCEHAMLGSKVVVKLLRVELAQREIAVERMRLEAQLLAQLRHPNIVKVTDFDTTPAGRPYLAMEYLRGRSLTDEARERGGYLPVRDALDWGCQALAGVGHAHAKGLVHRDIKLDNLFVCDAVGSAPRVVKVLDFGVAKIVQGGDGTPDPLAIHTRTGTVVGTPRFFAPEQARGKPLDGRSDLYALGLCLYMMVAGCGPFDDCTTLLEMAKAHVLRQPELPSRFARQPLPSELEAVIMKALAKQREDRFATAEAMRAELVRIRERLSCCPPDPERSEGTQR